MMKKVQVESPIIFYDGDCGLCNRTVIWILKNDSKGYFKFCSLQHELAKQLLSRHQVVIKMDTMYLLKSGNIYSKSDAAIAIIEMLFRPFGSLISGYRIIPRFIRDGIYDFVASNRKKFFGSSKCQLLSIDVRNRFL